MWKANFYLYTDQQTAESSTFGNCLVERFSVLPQRGVTVAGSRVDKRKSFDNEYRKSSDIAASIAVTERKH